MYLPFKSIEKSPTVHHMAELPWVKSFVHLTAVALTYGVFRINQDVNLEYLIDEISDKDAAEESIENNQNMNPRTGKH